MRWPPVDNVSGVGNNKMMPKTINARISPIFCALVRPFGGAAVCCVVLVLLTVLIINTPFCSYYYTVFHK